jgi:hypothetical protein
MGAPASDVVVRGGQLEAPIVDFTELQPGCHK